MRMWNVSGLLVPLFLSSSLIVGCTGAVDPSVSFLSFSLPSLKNTGASPFQQELESQGYIELQGTCDKSVTGFQFQFDRNGWKDISASGGMAPPGVTPPARPYDADCSDGLFFIYLFADELQAYLPAGQNFETYSPSAVHLRGVAGPFTTEPLTFYGTGQGPGGGGGPEANSFIMRPLSSRFGVDLCMPVDLMLVYVESGSTAWSGWVSNSAERQIGLNILDFTSNDFKFYSDGDCQTGIVSAVSIPKNEVSKRLYFKGTVSGTGRIHGTGVGFGGMGVEGPTSIEIRSTSDPYEVRFSDSLRRPSAGTCQTLTVFLQDDHGAVTSTLASEIPVLVSGEGGSELAGVSLFDNRSCQGSASPGSLNLTFPTGGASWREISYRVDHESSTALFASSALLTSSEPGRHYINPWMAAHGVHLSSSSYSVLPYQAPDCIEIKVTLVDQHGYPQNTISFPAEFDYTIDDMGLTALYSNSGCIGTPASKRVVSFASGDFTQKVYLKLASSSQAAFLTILGYEEVPPMSPPRLNSSAVSWTAAVVGNLVSLGGSMRQVFRLPRVLSGIPLSVPLSDVPVVSELGDAAYSSSKMSVAYNATSPLAVHVGQEANRAINQRVWELNGGDGIANSVDSNIFLTMGYTAAIMFRTSATGTQVLMGFRDQAMEQYVIGPSGSVNVMGCSMGLGLNDGNWHTLVVSRGPLFAFMDIYYQIDDQTPQSCSVDPMISAMLPSAFTAPFGVGKLDSANPGLVGQVVEVLYDDSQAIYGLSDPLFGRIRQHLNNRYPLK
ncbi:MAG: hypothetical protein KF789_13545 [Bdellovibrionaceae bacterium]|nr:hypothetical protein [Pseudobdellovibrionaceae bacterium]